MRRELPCSCGSCGSWLMQTPSYNNQLGGMGEAHAHHRKGSFTVQSHPSFGMSIAPLLYPLPVSPRDGVNSAIPSTGRGMKGEASCNFYATIGLTIGSLGSHRPGGFGAAELLSGANTAVGSAWDLVSASEKYPSHPSHPRSNQKSIEPRIAQIARVEKLACNL